MSNSSYPQEDRIFADALALGDPQERAAYLDGACGDDHALRAQIEELLRHHAQAGDFLETPAAPQADLAPLMAEGVYFRRTRSRAHHGDQTKAAPSKEDDLLLDFLSRSRDPSHLGRLDGYEVLDVIGRGGMGIVFKALDERLKRIVAIKVLAPELAASAAARRRFLREGRAAAAVVHPNVVSVYAVGEAGLPYLVMELIDGESLQARLDREGPLELKEVLRIGAQVAEGLAAAHAHGLIHRDINPSNVLLENGGERVCITDFGLARAADDASITRSGDVAGTPQYMSPEQAQGLAVDVRSDMFSLGCVLYAMCAGQSPFHAESALAAIRRVCDEAPQPLHEINPEAPLGLVETLDSLLGKRPDQRPRTAAEIARLFGEQLRRREDPDSTVSSLSPPRRQTRAKSPWRIVGLIAFAVIAGLGVTEMTGVTRLAPSVIGLVSGEARREEVVTGARPGSPPTDGFENPAQPIAPAAVGRHDAFLIRAEKEKGGERTFATLREAVSNAENGDTIEIRGDGPFPCDTIEIVQALTIRAASGSRPVLQPQTPKAEKFGLMMVMAPLVLEGVALERTYAGPGHVRAPTDWRILLQISHRGALAATNCRFVNVYGTCLAVYDLPESDVSDSPTARLRNCEFITGNWAGEAVQWHATADGRLTFDHCVFTCRIIFHARPPGAKTVTIQLRDSTMAGMGLFMDVADRSHLENPEPGEPSVRVEALRNVFAERTLHCVERADVQPPFNRTEAELLVPHVVHWHETQNLHPGGAILLGWVNKAHWETLSLTRGQDLNDWSQFWGLGETGSFQKTVRFQGGDLRAKVTQDFAQVQPDDFRLLPDSAGYRAGPNGKDLGADIDLVGPGEAYERSKQTPNYRQWLRDTCQRE